MKIVYLDVCCLNRPFDDQAQTRIRLESEAVLLILGLIRERGWEWIGSEVLHFEIQQTPDLDRRQKVELLASWITRYVRLESAEIARAEQLEEHGFKAFDALHLACAESGKADLFFSTDDGLLRKARRLASDMEIVVANPLIWLQEEFGE